MSVAQPSVALPLVFSEAMIQTKRILRGVPAVGVAGNEIAGEGETSPTPIISELNYAHNEH